MSREHETLSTIEDGPDSGGPIIPLVGKHTSCFTPEEDCFFDEGDALSRESSAFDPVDDATATRPFRARLLRRSLACRRWLLGCAVGAFLSVLTVTLVRAGVDGAGVVGEVAEARPPAMSARRPSTKPFGGVTERAPDAHARDVRGGRGLNGRLALRRMSGGVRPASRQGGPHEVR
jgi:hypothetical protein